MQVAPPSGGPARPQGAPPSPAQQPNAGGAPGQPGPAEQAIKMIQTGFQSLGKMIQAAGQKIPPTDIKLFQAAVQATDDFIQSLMGDLEGGQQGAPKPASPGGPMPANANAGALPAGQ